MSTDRTHDTPSQDIPPHTIMNLTEALFGSHIDQAWIAQSGAWDGVPYSRENIKAFSPDTRHHFSCALMKPGSKARLKENFAGAILFVLDDVGTVAAPGTHSITGSHVDRDMVKTFAPSGFYAVETSKGNFQIGWRIEVETDLARWEHFIRMMSQHPYFGMGVHDVVHYFRMETGSGKLPSFRTRLATPWDGTIWKLDDLAAAFGIDMSPGTVAASTRKTSSFSSAGVISPDLCREIMKALPNGDKDTHFNARNDWTGIAHAIRSTVGEGEGRDIWLEWNAQRTQRHGEPERVWDTLPPDSTNDLNSLRQCVINVYKKEGGETSDVFVRIAKAIADEQAPFTAVDDADVPDPGKQEPDRKRFRELLDALAKTQTIPDHHKGGNGKAYDAHWLPIGGGLLDIGSLSAGLPVAPPVMFEPFVRGGLTVIGGAPSVGKSNLSLDHALAMAAGRPDLIRNGVRLQFPGDVVYISNEDDLSVVRRRAVAWATYHGVDLAKMPHKLLLVRTGLFRKDGETWAASCLEMLERLLEHGKSGADIAMIFVDTLGTSVTGIDEHQIKDMTPVMGFLRDMAAAMWCGVAFLHHTTKEAWARGSADATLRSIATIRGSGGITGTYTRGATLIVAPNKPELDAHPDWATRDIVVEFMAKANDGPEGFVASYYERKLVAVEQVSAEDATKTEFRDEPVLVPFKPTLFGQDVALLDGYLDAIGSWWGPVQVVEKLSNDGSPNSVQKVLGVSNSAAKTIVDALVAAKKVTIVETDLGKGRVKRTLEVL